MKLRYPHNSEMAAYMRNRQQQQRARTHLNRNENWMAEKLATTGRKWTRQAVWGYRIFDFWCNDLGIAVEVDGPEHDPNYDSYRDEYNFRRSGIVVLRVRNMNEDDAAAALAFIATANCWKDRRVMLGIDGPKKRKKPLTDRPSLLMLHKDYIAGKRLKL